MAGSGPTGERKERLSAREGYRKIQVRWRTEDREDADSKIVES